MAVTTISPLAIKECWDCYLWCLVGPTFTFSTTVVVGCFTASFIGMKRPVIALLALSTVLAMFVFPAPFRRCEGLPKALGFDIGLGYPFIFYLCNTLTKRKATATMTDANQNQNLFFFFFIAGGTGTIMSPEMK